MDGPMSPDLGEIAGYGLTLLGGGAIGSLVTRWYDVRSRRREALMENRRKKIAKWRAALDDAESFDDVRSTSVWAQLREYMPQRQVGEALNTIMVTMGGIGDGGDPKLAHLQRVVNEVERKWELI